MKSSTLYRSNLSKEKMALLEELKAKSQNTSFESRTPDVYIRPAKEKELDVLWQNFKVNQKEEKSPGVYLITGFIAGALCMFLMTALLSFSSNAINEHNNADSPKLVKKVKAEKQKPAKLSIIPADQTVEEVKTAAPESYTVKSGDTLAGIVVRFYGKYDPSKITKIMEANNMSNPNALSIGQSLVIPMD